MTVKYCSDYSAKGLCGHADEKMVCGCSETPLNPALYPKQMIGAVEGYCETDEVRTLIYLSTKFFNFLALLYSLLPKPLPKKPPIPRLLLSIVA